MNANGPPANGSAAKPPTLSAGLAGRGRVTLQVIADHL